MKERSRARGWALQALYAWEARGEGPDTLIIAFEELASQLRNILRLGVAEILYVDDVPPRVTIREMMRLAEHYATPESPRFVNGVLDAVMRSQAPSSDPERSPSSRPERSEESPSDGPGAGRR